VKEVKKKRPDRRGRGERRKRVLGRSERGRREKGEVKGGRGIVDIANFVGG
jgi:hypothetical protein